MGQSVAATQEAIARLPGAVSFVFTPTSADPQPLVDEARGKGHEVLLAVPMQPVGYPANDPGANTLLLNQSDEENVRRLEAVDFVMRRGVVHKSHGERMVFPPN